MYMELKNMKQEKTKRVEVYYEWIQNLAHGLQVPTTYNFMITMLEKVYSHISELGLQGSKN